MREIKFRAWDTTNPCMFQTHLLRDYKKNECLGFNVNDKECVLMQFTGLKDKNGKEIYEGDIFRYTKNKHLIYPNFISKVEWYKWSFGFRVPNGLNAYDPFVIHDEIEIDFLPYVEIIGNIYENSDLLKDGGK